MMYSDAIKMSECTALNLTAGFIGCLIPHIGHGLRVPSAYLRWFHVLIEFIFARILVVKLPHTLESYLIV